MDTSKKAETGRPRVVYDPHRLRTSGRAARALTPIVESIPEVVVSETEVVSASVEIPVELIELEVPR